MWFLPKGDSWKLFVLIAGHRWHIRFTSVALIDPVSHILAVDVTNVFRSRVSFSVIFEYTQVCNIQQYSRFLITVMFFHLKYAEKSENSCDSTGHCYIPYVKLWISFFLLCLILWLSQMAVLVLNYLQIGLFNVLCLMYRRYGCLPLRDVFSDQKWYYDWWYYVILYGSTMLQYSTVFRVSLLSFIMSINAHVHAHTRTTHMIFLWPFFKRLWILVEQQMYWISAIFS